MSSGSAASTSREDVGGSGLSRSDAVAIIEELAKGDPAIAAYISIHNMVAWMIDTYGNEAQRHRWLPRADRDGGLRRYCLTEPGAGSDAARIATVRIRDGDDYVLTGVKQFISGAGEAAVYVVMARTGEPGSRGISAFIVPGIRPGSRFGANEKKMGWNAQPTRQVILDEVRVPASALLGVLGQGFKIAMSGLNGGRINIAACSLGGAQWALDRAVRLRARALHLRRAARREAERRVHARRHGDRAACGTRAGAGCGARPRREAPDAAMQCAMAKRFATDAGFRVANEALQLHGGYGYLHDYGIEKVVRDLRVHQILEGTNEIMRVIIGRELLEHDARDEGIAFLGLGHMGLPMARNLAAAGHEVIGFDVFPAAVEAARAGRPRCRVVGDGCRALGPTSSSRCSRPARR